jgi:hypothetical protein
MTADVCAIVLAHDQPQFLERVLADLKNQSVAPSRVLIVDTSKQLAASSLIPKLDLLLPLKRP